MEKLVLIPGLLSDEAVWTHQERHLCELAEIKIVVLKKEDTPEKMVETILKGAPKYFSIAGHSMGGWLSLEVMRAAPERVRKLCLINTTARNDTREKLLNRKKMVQRVKEGHLSEVAKQIADAFVHNEKVKKDVLEMFLRSKAEEFINQQNAMIMRSESMSILPSIKVPTLVIHASKDKNFSLEEHVEMVSRIPHAKLGIVDDSGHMSPMEVPQAVTALMRFWLMYF